MYFPTTGPDGDDEFSHYIGKLHSIIAECDEENVCVIEEYDASPGSARFTELMSMCGVHQLVSFLKAYFMACLVVGY